MAYALIFTEDPFIIKVNDKVEVTGERIAAVSNNLLDITGPFKWVDIPAELVIDNNFAEYMFADNQFLNIVDTYEKYGVPINFKFVSCPTCP